MDLAAKILNRLALSKPQRRFVQRLFLTILITRGKMTFRNLSRYSTSSEKTYSRQFARPMDWIGFNRHLIDEVFGLDSERVVAFDPSFLPKAGKHTFGRAAFWNGLHSRTEKGLEISAVAVVDVPRHQGLTLSVQQTQRSPSAGSGATAKRSSPDDETLLDTYLAHLRQVRPFLRPCESYLSVDGGLTRKKLLDGVCGMDLHLIGKLRCDADMRYLYQGPPRKGPGRPKVYDGKVDWTDLSRLEYVGREGAFHLYTAVLNHVHFQRNLRVVLLRKGKPEKKHRPILLCATDVRLEARTVYRYYRARFQVEFLFRDGKQFTGLSDCQARDQARLDFHFNASLTTLNLAKAEQMADQEAGQPMSCSMASIKAQYFNQHYLERIMTSFGLESTWVKSRPEYQRLREYGTIAA